jgi:ferric-dicitrate binding protein FerR (iron transport regulator)
MSEEKPEYTVTRRPNDRLRVELVEEPTGAWTVRINGGAAMPATDVEVALWKQLQEVKRAYRRVCVEDR